MRARPPSASIVLTLALLASCEDNTSGKHLPDLDYTYEVPLQPDSPWPKFRRTARQDGASIVTADRGQGQPWTFTTGKGIFSTPVVAADGTVMVGSADRVFYAINPDGSEKWSFETGEIIDSSALLDDQGKVYFGSGDGVLRALDAEDGALVWEMQADDPSVNDAFIRWFEGNVAMGPDGTLYVPNDNFYVYAVDRADGSVKWRFRMQDQTWSLPAVDPQSGNLYIGNNNLLEILGDNTFAIAPDGSEIWSTATKGSIAASPALTADGKVLLGGFDGYLRAYDAADGTELWAFAARDHLYASPGLLPDGRIVQPAADGTVYCIDPADGSQVWAFDIREAVRSSPAIDGEGHIYVGAGDGRLYVLDPDGTLRWAIQLITDERNDLNASPALGDGAVYIAGESGAVFAVPFDWCLGAGRADPRCVSGPDEDLPRDGVFLLYTTPLGAAVDTPSAELEPNAALAFSLFVRQGGDTVLAHLDSDSIAVTIAPPAEHRVLVSGDRKFLTVEPTDRFTGDADGKVSLRIQGDYLVNPDREGLAFSGGTRGGGFDETYAFTLMPAGPASFPLPVPAAPGEDSGVLELYRLAAPIPPILPSYNQIGFDSHHLLIGLVEGDAHRAVGWVVTGLPAEGEDRAAVDPQAEGVFPLSMRFDDGALTMESHGGLKLKVQSIDLVFEVFRLSAMLDGAGQTTTPLRVHVTTICENIPFYGMFMRMLGFCNPQTDTLVAYGSALLRPHQGGVQSAPGGLGTVAFAAEAGQITATVTGNTLKTDEHRFALMLVDAATGAPVNLDYLHATDEQTAADGTLQSLTLSFEAGEVPAQVRAYVMVDVYPAAMQALTVP